MKENRFCEDDIRSDSFLEKLEEARIQDRLFLLERKDDFIEVECPACGTINDEVTFTKLGFSYKKCCFCQMLYISPRPTLAILDEYYANSQIYKVFNDSVFPKSEKVRREKIVIPRVEKVVKLCKEYSVKTNKILEIGAAFGSFCEEMAKTNTFTEVVGVEACDSLAKTSTEKGFRVYNGILEHLDIQETFNVAVAFEVIGTIYNPKEFLRITSTLLDAEGLLFLSFQNCEGFDLSILQDLSTNVDYGLLNYFTAKSITMLLTETGYNVLNISTPGELDVDIVRKAILAKKYTPDQFIKYICVDNFDTIGALFQEFLKENSLSSHMFVVARKS